MTRFTTSLLFSTLLAASPAFAAGPSSEPPTPTETTTQCPEGSIWNGERGACVLIEGASLDYEDMIEVARELAYADRFEDAISLLERADVPDNTMVQTYLGFAHRSAGRFDLGMEHYGRALELDPDNYLARSYMGMAHVIAGNIEIAQVQLNEIEARGGANTWAYTALSEALSSGEISDY